MADNISQSQHITGLDFDISKALKDLQELESEVQKTAKKIAETDWSVGDIVGSRGAYGVATESYNQQKTQQKSLLQSVEQYYAKLNALEQAYAKKKISNVDYEIGKRELAAKMNADNIKRQMTSEVAAEKEKAAAATKAAKEAEKAEKEKAAVIEKVYTVNERAYKLAQKGKNISDTGYVGEQKKVKQLQEQTDELVRQIKLSGDLTDEQKEQLSVIQQQLREQENIYTTTATTQTAAPTSAIVTGAKNFLRYNVANAAWQGMKAGASDVVDIETRVMEISRVMNLSSESAKELRDNLIDYGIEYGRSFDEVSEISLKFTQAGYEANDVLTMTKAMLLGINTAELNAESGTTSLIGIMQQWGYEASELETIIDKLNYTSDNNAITTQDLTDALLQASSVAKIAGMNFEDTIGVLTAMKEASGRTGKEVGNAFKSILSYVQRESSLKVFDAAGIEVYANKATGELLPMMEILTNMAAKWGSVGDSAVDALVASADEAQLFSEEMAAVLGMEDEYSKMLREVNDAEARGVTQAAAGVFRRNYFIALMEKFAKTTDVSTEALDAEGYSIRENSRYMETFEAKMKQLQTSLEGLAVQAADSGLLDIAKQAIDAATAIVNMDGSLQGIVSVLLSILGVVTLLNAGKISQEIVSTITVIKTAITTLKSAEMGIKAVTAAEQAAAVSTVSLAGAFIALAAVVAVIGLVVKAAKEAEEQNKALRQSQIESYEEAITQREELDKLKAEYDELNAVEHKSTEQRKRLNEVSEELNKQFGNEWVKLKDLTAGTQEYNDKLNEMTEAKKSALMVDMAGGIAAYSGELNAASGAFITEKYGKKIFSSENVGASVTKYGGLEMSIRGDEAAAYEAYVRARDELVKQASGSSEDAAKLGTDKGFAALNALIKEMEPAYNSLIEAEKRYNQALYITGERALPYAINSQEDYNRAVREGYIVVNESTKANKENANAVKKSAFAFTQQAEAVSATAENIDDYMSSISMLNGHLQTLNSGGSLTAEQIFTLIDKYPELTSKIYQTADGFGVETEALELLNEVNKNAAIQYKISQIENSKIVSENVLRRLEAYGYEADAIQTLADAQAYLATNSKELLENRRKQDELKTSIGGVSDVQAFKQLQAEETNLINEQNALNDAIGEYSTATTEAKEKIGALYDELGKSSGKAGATASETKSILNELLSDFDRLNDMGLLTISEQIEYLNYVLKDTRLTTEEISEVQSKLFSLYKQQIQEVINKEQEASEARQDAIKKTYDDRIATIKTAGKEEIDAIKSTYNAEIDALKQYKSALSAERNEEDYNEKRNKLLEERAYWEQRTGREAVEKIDNIDDQIESLDKSYSRSLEDEQINAQVAMLEQKRDNEVAYREQMQEIELENLQAQMEAEIAAEKKKYETFKQQFTEAQIDMIAASGVYANDLYKQFYRYFTQPLAGNVVGIAGLMSKLFAMRAQLIGGTSLDGTITIANPVKASTGGYTLGDGMMMLHKNEFIVNPALTERLDKFLEAYDSTAANYSPNSKYLRNPLGNDGNPTQQINNNSTSESKKIVIAEGAFQATYNVADKADAKASTDEFAREIMKRISNMN
jgi:TP901 family phage tail tape measure protein